MVRRLGVFGSAGVLLASAFVSVATLGVSPAHAASFQDWATVSAGRTHTCGVRSNGKLYCWGSDNNGKLGNGDESDKPTPWRIGSFEDWATVSAGGDHSCGVRRNGKLYCWGSDDYGQIGDGGDPLALETPKRIGSFEDWATVSAGQKHTCGVRANGKLYCWGSDESGQVGDGNGFSSSVSAPQRAGTFEDWASVSAGYAHSCGVRSNGKLYCWGSDSDGQVGDGDDGEDPEAAPRRVGTFEDWATVSAGGVNTCGVRSNGKLYCWGLDEYGEVGDGGVAVEDAVITSPVRIGTFEDWVGVSTGFHTCGVRKNGKLYCWGADYNGEVGDGGIVEETVVTSPVRIGTFEDWATVSAGETYSCGIRANHKLYCWGSDDNGQIGDGYNTDPATAPRRI